MGDSSPVPFEVTKYGFDREHELELNRFTHALEMEQLKLLILLNGGAATLLVTFAEKAGRVDALWFPFAIGCWLFGVIFGAWATIVMRSAQADYAKAFRHRRRATEWRRFSVESPGADLVRLLGLPEQALLDRLKKPVKVPGGKPVGDSKDAKSPVAPEGARLNDEAAGLLRDDARAATNWINRLSGVSLALFVAGAMAAAAMVSTTPAPGAVSPQPPANSAASR